MIIQNRTSYIAIAFSKENNERSTIYLKSKSDFKKYQDLGYNIYYILNDFFKRRTKDDLVWFKYIGIDLDFKKDKPLYKDLKKRLDNNDLSPSKVNATYKGYHLFFRLSQDLYDLDSQDYEDLYEYINNLLGGDEAMKSITGVLKMENTIDIKDGRNYTIKTKLLDTKARLSKKKVEKILGREVNLDSKRKESYKAKKEKRKRNVDFINDLDSKEFLINFNKYFPDKEIKIRRNLYETGGIRLFKYKGKYNIKDFTKKSRWGNYNFLFKVLLKGDDSKDTFPTFIKMLKREYNYSFNYSLKKEPYFNNLLTIDFKNLTNLKNITLEKKGYYYKILRAIYYLDYLDIEISRKKICGILQIKWDNIQYKKIDEALSFLCSLEYEGPMVKKRWRKNFLESTITLGLRKEKMYQITFPKIKYAPVWGNTDVFKVIKKNSKMSFLVFEILDNISLYGSYKYSISYSIRVLDSNTLNDDTQKNTLRRILMSLKKEDLITKYTIRKDILFIN